MYALGTLSGQGSNCSGTCSFGGGTSDSLDVGSWLLQTPCPAKRNLQPGKFGQLLATVNVAKTAESATTVGPNPVRLQRDTGTFPKAFQNTFISPSRRKASVTLPGGFPAADFRTNSLERQTPAKGLPPADHPPRPVRSSYS